MMSSSLYDASDRLLELAESAGATVKADPLPIREQLDWQRRSLNLYIALYGDQQRRIDAGLAVATRDDVQAVISNLYAAEPPILQAELVSIYEGLSPEIVAAAASAIDLNVDALDTDILRGALLRAYNDLARVTAGRLNQTSLDLSLVVVRDWLIEPAATMGDLRERMGVVWPGSRPRTAARTETTRLAVATRDQTWQVSGLVRGFNVVTRNDSLVRESHRQIAAGSPYPLGDTQHMPPFDPNCRCGTTPALMVGES